MRPKYAIYVPNFGMWELHKKELTKKQVTLEITQILEKGGRCARLKYRDGDYPHFRESRSTLHEIVTLKKRKLCRGGHTHPERIASVLKISMDECKELLWLLKESGYSVEDILEILNTTILDRHDPWAHGVEAIGTATRTRYTYVNRGETYAATVLWDHNLKKWIIASWGDCLEYDERRGIHYG